MVGLHTDHGLVPKIVLQDDIWRYFCANWNSTSGLARIYLRKKGVETHEVFEGRVNFILTDWNKQPFKQRFPTCQSMKNESANIILDDVKNSSNLN